MVGCPAPNTIPALYRWRSEVTPSEIGIYTRSADNCWLPTTWKGLWSEVVRISTAWRNRGLKQGDRLGIVLPSCFEWEVAQLAGLVNGAVIVGIDLHAPIEEILWVLDHSQVSWLIVTSDTLAAIPRKKLDQLKSIIVVGNSQFREGDKSASWNEFGFWPHSTGDLDDSLVHERRPHELATLIYTSGTTGDPKGIGYAHEQLMAACRVLVNAFPELDGDDRTLCWLPMSALFQRMVNLAAATIGMKTYFIDDPKSIMQNIAEVAPSFLVGVPRFFEKLDVLLRQIDGEVIAKWQRQVKFMISGSAALPCSILESLYSEGLLVLEAYGLTENTIPVSANRVTEYRFGSVGKPLAGNDVRFDRDGEILIRGPGLFGGYYRESRSTLGFTDEGYYRTGDCGYLDEDGFLYLTGRKAEIIKTSTGRRVSPVAIESVFAQCPFIDQIVVFGNGKTRVVALVTLQQRAIEDYLERCRGTSPFNETDATRLVKQLILQVLQSLDDKLADFEHVKAVGILSSPLSVDRGELTTNGKVRRNVIENKYSQLIGRLYLATRRCVLFDGEQVDDT